MFNKKFSFKKLIVFQFVFLLMLSFAIYPILALINTANVDSTNIKTTSQSSTTTVSSQPIIITTTGIVSIKSDDASIQKNNQSSTEIISNQPSSLELTQLKNNQSPVIKNDAASVAQPVIQSTAETVIKQSINTEPVIDADCKVKNILDRDVCKNYLAIPLDCRQKGIASLEECWKNIEEATAKQQTKEILVECREQGINNYGKCKDYMSISIECREHGIKTASDCDKYLSVHPDCRAKKIFDKEKCDKYMSLSFECRQKGIDDIDECQKFIYRNAMPTECVKAGSETQAECSQVLFILSLPIECRDKKITNRDECNKYLEINSLPKECRDKGVITKDECDKIIKNIEEIKDAGKIISTEPKLNINVKCVEVNIIDIANCEKFLKKITLPKECQSADIVGEKECNNFLFKKTASKECLAGGITDDKECKEFMFNKYLPKIKKVDEVKPIIENKTIAETKPVILTDWQRKNSIEERHLGDIVTKQTQFQEIKNNIIDLIAEPTKIENIEKYQVVKELVPLKGDNVGLKIIATKDSITLDSADNLSQTSPIALMIDSDQDGLSDDIEKRIGANPNDKDTDKDGYTDGVEFNNKYNPLGTGKLKQFLAPIDQAIAENKILGQPKTEGRRVNHLSAIKVDNSAKQKAGNDYYEFSGKAKANSVITLYIYSDLPIVVTVKTDEYGNWKYNFSQPLTDGIHEVYVAVNDNTGKVVEKSNPLSFFVKEAKAVSVNDFMSPALASALVEDNETKGSMAYYFIVGSIIGIGLSLFLLFIKQKRQKL